MPIPRHLVSSSRARRIPNYAMYGDNAPAGGSNMFNFEWIPERSPLYGWEIDPHEHQSLIQILYMTEGLGHALLDDVRWPLRAPALVVVPAGRVHGFEFNPQVNGVVVTAAQKPLEAMAQIVMPELLHTLRERHVRHSAQRAGYGLGLSIVNTIAHKHGAELVLASPPPGAAHGFEATLVLQSAAPNHS